MHSPQEEKGKAPLTLSAFKVPKDEMLRGRRSQVRPTGLDPVPSYCASCNELDIICGIGKAKEFIMTHVACLGDSSSSAVSSRSYEPSDRKFAGFYHLRGEARKGPAPLF